MSNFWGSVKSRAVQEDACDASRMATQKFETRDLVETDGQFSSTRSHR